MQNPKDILDPTTAIDMALIAQPGMNMDQDRHMLMVEDNVGNTFRPNAGQTIGNQNGYNVVQNVGNQFRHNVIAQKEEAGIQLNSKESDFMVAASAYDEIEEVTVNCTLKDNLQQALASGTQTDKALVYDSDGSAEVSYLIGKDSGANERPPILERGNYIPWESRFRRFLNNKLEDGERMWNSIQNGPYKRPMIPNPDNDQQTILEPLSKMTEVDACKNAKDMWERMKRLMFGSDVTSHVRHSCIMDEFDKFAEKEGESLELVYERLTTLVNIMDRNNVRPIPMSINTKFLNFLQPEWSKYVTMKAAKNHVLLALLVHSNASSSQSYANSSYSPQPYYVIHPSLVVDYEDEYQGELQGDSQEDKLTTAMMLLARAITQKFSTPTNNRLRTSSNTRNQAVVQVGRVDIQSKIGYGGNGNKNAGRQNRNQAFNAGNRNDDSNQIVQRVPRTESTLGKENVQCYNYNEKGHYARDCQKPRVRDAKYFIEQMLLAMKDEAGSILKDEENDLLLDNSYGEETMEELTVAVMLMARIQPANGNTETVPSYDVKAVSE
ncbi:putative ribonuclease H-like domain-containing protein, partial [Tanacetum coccineum]